VVFYFGLYDTTRTSLLWILKFLVDNPDVFRRIQAEQQEIFQGRDLRSEEPRLTWEDTRKMVYAAKFFQEVQRTLSIAPFVIRKATQHAEFEGKLIPKDWRVMVMLNFIHSDPNLHPDPQSFNPDRFDVPQKPFTYLPFSAGSHLCPGIETAKLISFIYIHHLTTTYTFESAGPDLGVEFNSMPTPIGGYPITISRRK
jgi:(+)-abscisic acid 8'-hydroxylase